MISFVRDLICNNLQLVIGCIKYITWQSFLIKINKGILCLIRRRCTPVTVCVIVTVVDHRRCRASSVGRLQYKCFGAAP